MRVRVRTWGAQQGYLLAGCCWPAGCWPGMLVLDDTRESAMTLDSSEPPSEDETLAIVAFLNSKLFRPKGS